MANILADSRWVGPHGIGRFAGEVLKRLGDWQHLANAGSPLDPLDPLRVTRALKRLRPDAYFSPGFNPPLRCATPFVFTIHDLIHLRFRRESGMLRRAYYGLVVRPAARRAFRVLTVSRYSKRQIVAWAELPQEKVVVVGNGVGAPFVPAGRRHRAGYRYLLHVGSGKPHKNIPRLLEAFAALGADCELRLVFTGQARPAMEKQIRKLRLADRVSFVGVLDDEALSAHYRGAAALVLPSLCEGFGLPALEAMACGTPVVASNVASLPEVVLDAALLVDPYDVRSIAHGIRRIVEDQDLRKTLVQKGLRRAGDFSWDRTAALVRRVLEQAAEASSRNDP
ncbi:MAG: glycosyltransferase family 4 protein [Phycisphaerae bacterium]|nr:glycosyltransferase family 4 protein [Phycisphaerae bacterium]